MGAPIHNMNFEIDNNEEVALSKNNIVDAASNKLTKKLKEEAQKQYEDILMLLWLYINYLKKYNHVNRYIIKAYEDLKDLQSAGYKYKVPDFVHVLEVSIPGYGNSNLHIDFNLVLSTYTSFVSNLEHKTWKDIDYSWIDASNVHKFDCIISIFGDKAIHAITDKLLQMNCSKDNLGESFNYNAINNTDKCIMQILDYLQEKENR